MATHVQMEGNSPPAGNVKRHLSSQERAELGKAARRRVPRAAQGVFDPPSSRPDPVSLLERQAESRVPELVPIRYGRMLVSPFSFFRGAALVMASDLATTVYSGLTAQICGDAHMSNFGLFASPERTLMFDVNDFDETLPGPWEWDVKRLAASVVVAGGDRGFPAKVSRTAAIELASAYRREMRRLAVMTNLDVWYSHLDVQAAVAELESQSRSTKSKKARTMAATATKLVAASRTHDSLQALGKLTRVVAGQHRIISNPPLVVPTAELLAQHDSDALMDSLDQILRRYRRSLQSDRRHLLEQYRLLETARKVVGIGSVGTRAWILLLVGADPDDVVLLQAKEAEDSVLEEFVGKSGYTNHGQRVVAGQHLMQAASDIFLGWDRAQGIDDITRDFYLRQLRDWKGSLDVEAVIPPGLIRYGTLCAQALARAHARSGDRIAIAAYLGTSTDFERAIGEFAVTYAEQNRRDYDAFKQAVASGRITATTGL